MKVAINGFGRIGRQFLQAAFEKKAKFKIVAINDITDIDTLAYLLKYDSVHGKSKLRIVVKENHLIINGQKILILKEMFPERLPWKKLKVDLVLESTGLFRHKKDLEKHINAGAKRVLLSAPAKDDIDCTIVLGVNFRHFKKTDKIISMASCTTNCVAPMFKVLNDKFGIKHGFMTTTHAYTADQKLVDAPHKDLRRGRSAAVNIVLTSTGAAKSAGEVIPELKGKLDGYAIRVPVADGSISNLSVELEKTPTVEQVNHAFKEYSKKFPSVIEFCQDPIVSSDIIHNSSSCIFDSLTTKVINNMVFATGWYDNEWGYSNRLVDLIKLLK